MTFTEIALSIDYESWHPGQQERPDISNVDKEKVDRLCLAEFFSFLEVNHLRLIDEDTRNS